MRNLYLVVATFLFASSASAQLYVQDPDATPGVVDSLYIYVKDQVLFVEQDIELSNGQEDEVDGNIYLRDKAQLVQGTSNGVNDGTGVVSVYQRGTTHEYNYNFWCPPISQASASASGNSVFGYNFLKDRMNEVESRDVIVSTDYTSYASTPLILSTYWLWKFVANDEYAEWEHVSTNMNLNPGEGFSMKGVRGTSVNNPGSNQLYDFRGRPNNGDIEVAVLDDNFSLVGNPYPSAMDIDFYLIANSTSDPADLANCGDGNYLSSNSLNPVTTGTAYFWEDDPNVSNHNLVDYIGGYATYEPIDCSTDGVYTPAVFKTYNGDGTIRTSTGTTGFNPPLGESGSRYAPIGQGFMVEGTTTGSIIAKNDFRVFVKENNTTSFFKSGETLTKLPDAKNFAINPKNGQRRLPVMRLESIVNDLYTRTLALAFYEESTVGYDTAKDGKAPGTLKSDTYFTIENEKYVINTQPFDEESGIPLTFISDKEGSFSLKISEINFDIDEVYLHDKQNNTYNDILYNGYSFRLPAGEYKERFEIVFKNGNQETLAVNEEIAQAFTIFQNNRASQLEVLNPSNQEISSFALYDTTGRLVQNQRDLGTDSRLIFSTANLSDGVYISKIVTSDQVEIVKKVSVQNFK
ncbi:T9SS type A sorting domain-containing protein [Croceiramulus getboli]|nr:T9SS type A sorting domain-containing protein [Flavobacteriaceae bacterium YJPT1-3]